MHSRAGWLFLIVPLLMTSLLIGNQKVRLGPGFKITSFPSLVKNMRRGVWQGGLGKSWAQLFLSHSLWLAQSVSNGSIPEAETFDKATPQRRQAPCLRSHSKSVAE